MNPIKTGELIRLYRNKLGLTQRQLAERIHVSDKAVSKWERGNGCPDISLLYALAEVFQTDLQTLLNGETEENERNIGNMKKIRFYICKTCGNIITSAAPAAITCCGRKLTPEEPKPASDAEKLHVSEIDGEWFVTSDHPMTKEHYIAFAAYLTDSSVMLFRQYPEWNFQLTIPMYRSGSLIRYCTKCGLLRQELRPLRK